MYESTSNNSSLLANDSLWRHALIYLRLHIEHECIASRFQSVGVFFADEPMQQKKIAYMPHGKYASRRF